MLQLYAGKFVRDTLMLKISIDVEDAKSLDGGNWKAFG